MPALGRNASIALGVSALVLLPASIGVMGTSANLIEAVNPKALWRTLWNMQVYYLWVLAVIAAYALATLGIVRLQLWSALQFAWSSSRSCRSSVRLAEPSMRDGWRSGLSRE